MIDDAFLFIPVVVLSIILLLIIMAIISLCINERRRLRRIKRNRSVQKQPRLASTQRTIESTQDATSPTQSSAESIVQRHKNISPVPVKSSVPSQQITTLLTTTSNKESSTARPIQPTTNRTSDKTLTVTAPVKPTSSLESVSSSLLVTNSIPIVLLPMAAREKAPQNKLIQQATKQSDADNVDFDAIYESTYEHNGSDNGHNTNILLHLLSQLSIGMDLSKVTLPTHVLERRSLLEMYADFFVHPDDFTRPTTLDSPEERFLAVLRYYLNSFLPARRTDAAKKPYNPVLGEVFRCKWTLPGILPAIRKTANGPWPGSSMNQVTFIGEQVSHHPPISAFYAEHPESGVSFNGQIYTKSSFLGLSIGVYNIGIGTLTLKNRDENYTVNFPDAFCRSIMTTPWVELGGKVEICCKETQYRAEIHFLTKGTFGGRPHQIKGKIFHGDQSKRPIIRLKGDWKSVINYRREGRKQYTLFTNVMEKPEVRKECLKVMDQEERESRKVWRHVTAALYNKDVEAATQAKKSIEQRQRDEQEERERDGVEWVPRFFEIDKEQGQDKDGNTLEIWHYNESLPERNSI